MKKTTGLLCALLLCTAIVVRGQVDRYTLMINEIMADPSPIVGLPNAEYIELKNNGATTINLNKWRIQRGNSTATIQSAYQLKPDSMVVICSRTQAVLFNDPDKTIGITAFPSLGNEGDLISILSPEGKTIDAVEYDTSFYGNGLKAQGGWSIELINPALPCSKNNWKASINNKGGTPGKENSVLDKRSSAISLKALQCTATSSRELLLELNMGADSTSLASITRYQLMPWTEHPLHANPIGPLFNKVLIQLPMTMKEKQVYVLKAENLLHCNGKTDSLRIKTGIASLPTADNLVINELLFNPLPGERDFVELYNKGGELLNLKEVYLGTKDALGRPGNWVQASTTNHNFFPGEYRVLTENTALLKKRWDVNEEALLYAKEMPSLPDDKGNLLLANGQGLLIDELDYTEDMHFPMIHDRSGVSLERIDPLGKTNDKQNWHSAASGVRYATPTKANSQHTTIERSSEHITVHPTLFSPDNDGINDLLQIHYTFKQPGTMLSAYLFNTLGSCITTIVNNRLCGTSGQFSWNGLDEKHRKPSRGLYIVLVETADLNGKRSSFKKAIAIR